GLTDQPATHGFDGYEIMFRVEPYPEANVTIAQNEYRLIITVTKEVQSNVEISPAPIHDIKTAVIFTQPPEVLVYIQGGLRDSCTTFYDLRTERSGTNINIDVDVQTATDQFCAQVYSYFEKCVNLGSDFSSGQVYTVNVNDETTTFTMP
ncbi:MAG: hypothetical protein PHN78_05735, partial [Dehalococcoidales bacterium]|nr:hypothetical protein [Dehalococcoidales bacterium]